MKIIYKISLIYTICSTIIFFLLITDDDTRRIHPDSYYAIEKVEIDGTVSYHLTLLDVNFSYFEPSTLALEALKGVHLNGTDLYLLYDGCVYYINLAGVSIPTKLTSNSKTPHFSFISPEKFWSQL